MVYGIFGGVYSDWFVLGYFVRKKDAIEYCKKMNAKLGKYDDEYYIKEMYNLARNTAKLEDEICWEVDTKTWEFRRNTWMWRNGEEKYRVDEYDDEDIYVWLKPGNELKLPKIAQDYFAEWKAEKEGVC